MSKNYQIGSFRYRGAKLRLAKTGGDYAWQEAGTVWLLPERKTSGNIFSSVGLSAESWQFTVRKQDLTMADAIRFQGFHHFITAIDEPERGFYEVATARVNVVACQADMTKTGGGTKFPAALTEKYIRSEQQMPMTTVTTTFVLVTPKVIELQLGSLVSVAGKNYCVQIGHTLDAYKNEYEIERRENT